MPTASRRSRHRSPTSNGRTRALYIHDDFNIIPDLILTLGARTERVTISGTQTSLPGSTTVFDSSKDHQGEAYEAALTYLFGEKSRVFAKWAQVFRIPFLDEQASFYGFGTDAFYTNLEKETGTSYEAGILFYPLKDLKLSVTVYRIDMQDEIKFILDPITFIGQNINLDKTRHEGVEIAMVYEMKKRFRLAANFTGQDVTFQAGPNSGKNVPLVPQNMANAVLEIYPALGSRASPGGTLCRAAVLRAGRRQQFSETRQLHAVQPVSDMEAHDQGLPADGLCRGGKSAAIRSIPPTDLKTGFVPGGLVLLPGAGDHGQGRDDILFLGSHGKGDVYPGRRAASALGLLLCALAVGNARRDGHGRAAGADRLACTQSDGDPVRYRPWGPCRRGDGFLRLPNGGAEKAEDRRLLQYLRWKPW